MRPGRFLIGLALVCVSCGPTTPMAVVPSPSPSPLPSPTPLTAPLNLPDTTPVILYHDPADMTQLDAVSWDGTVSGKIGPGDKYGGITNSAGSRYVIGADVYDRSHTVVAQVPVDQKVFSGVWADDQTHYCQVVRVSLDAPPEGEAGMLQVGAPGETPRNVTRIGTFYPRGFMGGGPGIAACSIQGDRAIIGQSGGQGIGTRQYWAVQLSTGLVLWTHTPVPTRTGVVEVVASHDGRLVAENQADQSHGSATIYGADGAPLARVPTWINGFSWDGSLAVMSPSWMGGPVAVMRWRDQATVWSGPEGGYGACEGFSEPGGTRLAIGLRDPALPQTNGCEPVNLYVVSAEGKVVFKRDGLYLVPPLN